MSSQDLTPPPPGDQSAGWFLSSDGITERWWDGARWTEHSRSSLPPDIAPSSPTASASPADPTVVASSPVKGSSRRSRRGIIAITVGAVLLVGGGATGVAMFLRGGDTSHTVAGVMVVASYDGCGATGAKAVADRMQQIERGKTTPCPGGPGGGYSDIHDGAGVVMRDGTGKIIGTSALTGGIQQKNGVTYSFEFAGVPDADFYTVEVARRGELRFSHAEMAANSWAVTASLG